MGGGTSVLSPDKYSEAAADQFPNDDQFPLMPLAARLRVFQSSNSGEVIVLVDHGVDKFSAISDPSKWFELPVSGLQSQYLLSSKFNQQSIYRHDSMEKMDPLTLVNRRESSSIGGPQVFSTLKKATSALFSGNNSKSDSSSLHNSNSNSIDSIPPRSIKDSKQDDGANILRYKSVSRQAVDIEGLQSHHSTGKSERAAKSISLPLKLTTSQTDQTQPASRETVSTCEICGLIFSSLAGDSTSRRNGHCTCVADLKASFRDIDISLKPLASQLSQENQSNMCQVISDAIALFETRSFLTNNILGILKDIMNIRSYASDGHNLHKLHNYAEKQWETVHCLYENAPDDSLTKIELNRLMEILKQAIDQLSAKRSLLQKHKRVFHHPSDYQFVRALSKGSFATVYLAKHVDVPDLYFAIKVMDKAVISQSNMFEQVKRERYIMAALYNKGDMFVTLFASFQSRTHLFMVLEFVPGGDCLSLLISKKMFPEKLAKFLIAEVVYAISVLHTMGILHRDVKPDNILLTASGHIKLADFGMAAITKDLRQSCNHGESGEHSFAAEHTFPWQLHSMNSGVVDEQGGGHSAGMLSRSFSESSESDMSFALQMKDDEGMRNTPIGNVNYAAPEAVISAPYNQGIDWWAVGVLLFHFLSGKTPFEAASIEDVMENISTNRIYWNELPSEVSPICREFITGLLTHKPADRLGSQSSSQVLGHRYFTHVDFHQLWQQPSPLLLEITGPDDCQYFDYFSPAEATIIPVFEDDGDFDARESGYFSFNYLS